VDWDILLIIFVKDLVPFLIIGASVNCCSFDMVWVFILDTTVNIFSIELGLALADVSQNGGRLNSM